MLVRYVIIEVTYDTSHPFPTAQEIVGRQLG
ncbi:uncharacterized protein METZ01_LOCUS304934, partial [marine metagenome]